MKIKTFISYSHSDEVRKKELSKFLRHLENDGIIDCWDDRLLLPGAKFDPEIQTQLNSSKLIILLVSQDFLDSDYCLNTELFTALKQVSENRARVVSIILDHCLWKRTALKDFVVLPIDGKPLADFSNPNIAWTQITEQISKLCEEIKEEKAILASKPTQMIAELDDRFVEYLNQNELTLQHRLKDKLTLDDIFVPPDLRAIEEDINNFDRIISSTKILDANSCPKHVSIIGDEQSGKSALAKQIFKSHYQQGRRPALIRGVDINRTDIGALVNEAASLQYRALPKGVDTIIIEEAEQSRLNAKHLSIFLKSCTSRAEKVIFISSQIVRLNDTIWNELSKNASYEMLPFGHVLRGELINKWNALGQETTIDSALLHAENDKVTHHVDALLRKNIVPPRPVFILMILQTLESASPSDFSLTAYGHCYNALIQQALRKAKIKNELIDKYVNYLTEIANFIFRSSKQVLSYEEFEKFKTGYSEKYLIESHTKVLEDLCLAGLLKSNYDGVGFSYKYIYYFYAAKYIAENYRAEVGIIDDLCLTIHSEKSANILIFVTYHTKDQDVLDAILYSTASIFGEETPATLFNSDTEHFEEVLDLIPSLVMEAQSHQGIDDNRKSKLSRKDRAANLVSEESEEDDTALLETNTLADINRSAKAIEIIGQILRNRHASLRLDQLDALSKTAFFSGLRFLSFYFKLTKSAKAEIIDEVECLVKKDVGLTEVQVKDAARKIFHGLCYGVAFSVIRKISFSTGNDQLIRVYKKIATEIDTPATHLISICIELEFAKRINRESIEAATQKIDKHSIAYRLLQEIVMQHLYVHTINYTDRQWLSSKLAIPMKSQRVVQGQKQTKLLDS